MNFSGGGGGYTGYEVAINAERNIIPCDVGYVIFYNAYYLHSHVKNLRK